MGSNPIRSIYYEFKCFLVHFCVTALSFGRMPTYIHPLRINASASSGRLTHWLGIFYRYPDSGTFLVSYQDVLVCPMKLHFGSDLFVLWLDHLWDVLDPTITQRLCESCIFLYQLLGKYFLFVMYLASMFPPCPMKNTLVLCTIFPLNSAMSLRVKAYPQRRMTPIQTVAWMYPRFFC